MAYDPTNPPSLVTQAVGGTAGMRFFALMWIDPIAAVLGAGYISNAADLGMRAGDGFLYKDVNRGEWDQYMLIVDSVAANGTAVLKFPEIPEEALEQVNSVAPSGAPTYIIMSVGGRQVRVTLAQFISDVLSSYATLSALQASIVPLIISNARVQERTAGAGLASGSVWSRQSAQPDVPAQARVQDASGAWFKLEPDQGIIAVEMLGAQSGFLIDADTRTIFNALPSINRTTQHLYLIDQAVRRFHYILRAITLAQVPWSIVNGEVVFVPDAGIRAEQLDGCNFVKGLYQAFAPSKKTQGAVVTAAMLNAAEAIDADANADAINAAYEFAGKVGAEVHYFSPDTYPIGKTVRSQKASGFGVVGGRTRLFMVSSVPYNTPVVQTGEVGKVAQDVWHKWIIGDANFERRKNTAAGPVTGAPSGSVWALVYMRGGGLDHCQGYDARKHTCDITSPVYPTSGTPGIIADQATEMSQGVLITNCHFEGAGDDLMTTHGTKNSGFENCSGMFSTGADTNNSGGLEFDDGTEDCWAHDIRISYVNSPLQIKAHNAGRPATRITVTDITAFKCNNGPMIFHTDFGSTYARSALARDIKIVRSVNRWPLAWIASETIKTGFRYYGYDNVHAEIDWYQDGGEGAYFNVGTASEGVFGIYSGAGRLRGRFLIEGFATGNYGVNILATAIGPMTIESFMCTEGPLTAFRQGSTGAKCAVPAFEIIRASGGSTGVLGDSSILKIGCGWISGYTTTSNGPVYI